MWRRGVQAVRPTVASMYGTVVRTKTTWRAGGQGQRSMPAAEIFGTGLGLIAGVGLGAGLCVACDTATTSVEPITKIAFPTSSGRFQLLGHGCRKKYGLFSVYAVGLFVDRDDAKACQQFSLPDIQAGHVAARLELAFARTVDQATMIEALADSVAPRLPTGDEAAAAELQELSAALLQVSQGQSFAVHSRLCFDWEPRRDLLVIGLEGGLPVTIKAPRVARALFDVYLDEQAVSADAKASFQQGIEQMFAHPQ
ncbi:uncharacterized protein MONBRDRAFT_7496 [Monosiga brevicollis MX1]|uniref:Chalcone isomerase domain-containing protein n=1 Tax=Monosiga brevicollis TaxID=81824 RepID=A9UX50_MONBE|nr:uncharacterized protein MONBRDRAFT_7496 [Monosiga brevicollis MX1]EDQ90330.1 predicted protein [Monosiga brevicollis MX1]|eukprot:XP_001745097.1 hypothetical protein [Monosiga brevicollis MX1]